LRIGILAAVYPRGVWGLGQLVTGPLSDAPNAGHHRRMYGTHIPARRDEPLPMTGERHVVAVPNGLFEGPIHLGYDATTPVAPAVLALVLVLIMAANHPPPASPT
jgi:hypothetical protein